MTIGDADRERLGRERSSMGTRSPRGVRTACSSGRKIIFALASSSVACFRAAEPPQEPDALEVASASPGATVFERTIVHEAIAAPGGAGVFLIGRRRPDAARWTSEAWIALVDLEGQLRWEASVERPEGWAETGEVDPSGQLHVFGRSVRDGAWLASFDPRGRQRALRTVPDQMLLSFGVQASTLHLVLSNATVDDPGRVLWFRTAWDADPEDAEWVPLEEQSCGAESPCGAVSESLTHARSVELEVGRVRRLDLGGSDLLLLQLPPQAGEDARVVVRRHAKGDGSAAVAELERMLAAPTEIPPVNLGDPNDLSASWVWLWTLVQSWSTADAKRQAALGAWLLESACEPEIVQSDCSTNTYAYPVPSFFAPASACWRHAQLAEHLDAVNAAAFEANAGRWLYRLAASFLSDGGAAHHTYRDPDYEILDSLVDPILDAAIRTGHGEPFIRTMISDLGDAHAADRGIAALGQLPDDRSVTLARQLIDEMRDDYDRCRAVGTLRNFLAERNESLPMWQADRTSACDVLYVLCTGLQPGLEQQILGKDGLIHVVETCDEFRGDSRRATAAGLEPCRPKRWKTKHWDFPLQPIVASTCGTDEPLLVGRHTCGALIELESHTYVFGDRPNGEVVLDRIEIFHTSGF